MFLSSGCKTIDALLKGGLLTGEVTVVYGEAETGKTTLAIQTAIETIRRGFKVFFIDTDGAFSHKRFMQLAERDTDTVSEQFLLFSPESFSAQTGLIENIENYLTPPVRMIVIDSFTSQYRASLGSAEQTYVLNRELNRQLAYLKEIATRQPLAVLLTSQVHAKMSFPFGRTEPVAHRTLSHWAQTIIRITPLQGPLRAVTVERLRNQPASNRGTVRLTARGMEDK